jgi:GNAT superfamily N-acetyltransferase
MDAPGVNAPDPIRIRPAGSADARGIATVHVESWRTTYAGIVPAAHLANLSVDRCEAYWRETLSGFRDRESFVYVAVEPDGDVIGFASGGPERENDTLYRGELYAIYLLQSHQGRGIGSRLVRAVAGRLLQDGHTAMLLWVLADNPACKFYARLGGQRLREKGIEIGGASLVEAAYGWTDLGRLAEET